MSHTIRFENFRIKDGSTDYTDYSDYAESRGSRRQSDWRGNQVKREKV
jgi:hypothetical protein